MYRYSNLKGNSGVYAYEIGQDNITIQFNDGCVYLYTNAIAGSDNIEKMKCLATAGQGAKHFYQYNH